VLLATVLALGSAFIHAGWNLAVKQSTGDRLLALWGQFTMGAVVATPLLIGLGGIAARGWINVAISGAAHLPYCIYLARGYDRGDFSVVYPIARGGGAVLAAAGGAIFLHDQLSLLSALGIGIVALGLAALAGSASRHVVIDAFVVALTIGIYSVSDAHGVRSVGWVYAVTTALGTAFSTTAYLLMKRRGQEMKAALVGNWRRFLVLGVATLVTYGMVQYAFRLAPVGYVNGLRESSVVIATFIGARHLHEAGGRRRIAAALVVLGGLIVLLVSRL
jgi:uncharacterized membrane protein